MGGILDRRFGESDPTLSFEERMLGRFTKERQQFSKAVSFNLNDEEELTHLGQSLSKFDDFQNTELVSVPEEEESNGTFHCIFFSVFAHGQNRGDRLISCEKRSFWWIQRGGQ